MGRIYKEHRSLSSPCLRQAWFKLLLLKKPPVFWRVPPRYPSAAPAPLPLSATTTSRFLACIFAPAWGCGTPQSILRSAGMLLPPCAAAARETRRPTIPDEASTHWTALSSETSANRRAHRSQTGPARAGPCAETYLPTPQSARGFPLGI